MVSDLKVWIHLSPLDRESYIIKHRSGFAPAGLHSLPLFGILRFFVSVRLWIGM